jgi:hypothetical protein
VRLAPPARPLRPRLRPEQTPRALRPYTNSPVVTTDVSITIIGGDGNRVTSGKSTGTLKLTVTPSTVTAGFLKRECRVAFGKAPCQRQAAFEWASAEAGAGRGEFAPKKLYEGAAIRATYIFAPGNIGNLFGGGRHGRCAMGGRGFGFRGHFGLFTRF